MNRKYFLLTMIIALLSGCGGDSGSSFDSSNDSATGTVVPPETTAPNNIPQPPALSLNFDKILKTLEGGFNA